MEVLRASRNATIDFLARGATFGGGCPIGANRTTGARASVSRYSVPLPLP